jgi:hypothetical protein
MNDLTSENRALVDSDPLKEVQKLYGHIYTPSSAAILSMMRYAVEDIVMAEEYGHNVLSREEALKQAYERLDLIQRAYKVSIITEIKCRRGEWIAMA